MEVIQKTNSRSGGSAVSAALLSGARSKVPARAKDAPFEVSELLAAVRRGAAVAFHSVVVRPSVRPFVRRPAGWLPLPAALSPLAPLGAPLLPRFLSLEAANRCGPSCGSFIEAVCDANKESHSLPSCRFAQLPGGALGCLKREGCLRSPESAQERSLERSGEGEYGNKIGRGKGNCEATREQLHFRVAATADRQGDKRGARGPRGSRQGS